MTEYINDGYFDEVYENIPYDLITKFKVEEVLFDGTSEYQNILIFKSENHGRILVLDGTIQITSSDEYAYHEMIAFTSLACHENPRRVLIVGGGDGGMAKQVLKFPCVEQVDVCDIDRMVIDQCKKYFPNIAESFDNEKCNVIIDDGLTYLTACKSGAYDVIICDATDPGDLSAPLYGKEFYTEVRRVLTKYGVMSAQSGGSMWQLYKQQKNLIELMKKTFPVVNLSYISVPSFSCGQNGFVIASKDINQDLSNPYWKFTEEKLDSMEMVYYDTALHKSSFNLPRFVKKYLLESDRDSNNNVTEFPFIQCQNISQTSSKNDKLN